MSLLDDLMHLFLYNICHIVFAVAFVNTTMFLNCLMEIKYDI
jgi:hypothetical protein